MSWLSYATHCTLPPTLLPLPFFRPSVSLPRFIPARDGARIADAPTT